MIKFLGLALVAGFALWFVRHLWRRKKLEWSGQPVPEQTGLRPITLLSLVMLVMYAGFLLVSLLTE